MTLASLVLVIAIGTPSSSASGQPCAPRFPCRVVRALPPNAQAVEH